jgi:hypothetical protein
MRTLRVTVASSDLEFKVEIPLKEDDFAEWKAIQRVLFLSILTQPRNKKGQTEIDLISNLDTELLEHVVFFARYRKLKNGETESLFRLWKVARLLDFASLRNELIDSLSRTVRENAINCLQVNW